jgi:hypothetical protein
MRHAAEGEKCSNGLQRMCVGLLRRCPRPLAAADWELRGMSRQSGLSLSAVTVTALRLPLDCLPACLPVPVRSSSQLDRLDELSSPQDPEWPSAGPNRRQGKDCECAPEPLPVRPARHSGVEAEWSSLKRECSC